MVFRRTSLAKAAGFWGKSGDRESHTGGRLLTLRRTLSLGKRTLGATFEKSGILRTNKFL